MALPYDPSVILSIASLETAHQSVTAHPKFDEFLSEYRKLATDCELNDHYGVTLVHRHAHVNESQRLFDFKQTLQPFTISQDAHNLHGCPISPKSLSLQAGRWMPYEYELGHYENLDAEFLAKVKTLIERFDVNNVGLRRYPPDDPEELEVTDCAGISVKIPWESVSLTVWSSHKSIADSP